MELHPSKRILEIYPDAMLLPDSIGWFNRLQFTDPHNARQQMLSRNKRTGEWVCAGKQCFKESLKQKWGHGKITCRHLEALKEVIE